VSRRTIAAFVAAFTLLPFAGSAAPSDAPANVTIAYQPGLSYSNMIVMRERGVLEKQSPNTKITWTLLGATAASNVPTSR